MDIVELRHGRTRAAVIPEAGGRLHQLEVRDAAGRWLPLLRAPADPRVLLDEPLRWGSYVMAPWPGRIDGGCFTWNGRLHHVPVNFDAHSVHGRAVYRPWTLESRTSDACRMSIDFDDGWPFGGRAVQHLRLLDDGILQRAEVHATASAFPAGAGWHPWFRRDVRPAHDVRLLVDADQVYEVDEMVPTGWLPPVTGDRDLRGYPVLGDRRIDCCYRHPRGALRIGWGDVELTMEQGANVTHAVVYTPPDAVCVEPQTCAPDAFNLAAQGVDGAGMVIIRPRRPLVAATTWRWTIGVPP